MKTFMKKWWLAILLFALAIIFAVFGFFFLYKPYEDAKKADEVLEAIADNTTEETLLPEAEEIPDEPAEPAPETEPYVSPYQSYFDENDDMIAWLQIPDTVIDYPVMQTMDDENYYLKRGFDKKDNANGCLIMDTDSDVPTPGTNLIIHGHNMKNGSMFGSLKYYEDETYCSEHPYVYLYTKDGERAYEVIAVFRSQVFKKTDTSFKYYKFFQADTEEEFNNFYDNIMDMSLYDTGVTAEFGDNFITLSTCAYHVTNGRFVVVAKEITESEIETK